MNESIIQNVKYLLGKSTHNEKFNLSPKNKVINVYSKKKLKQKLFKKQKQQTQDQYQTPIKYKNNSFQQQNEISFKNSQSLKKWLNFQQLKNTHISDKYFIQNTIFKRRINSQQKSSKKLISLSKTSKLQKIQKNKSVSVKLNFAKKIIQDMKNQTSIHKEKFNFNFNQRYNKSQTKSEIKSKSINIKKQINNQNIRQKLIKSSLEKLKPSFFTNQANIYTERSKKKYNENHEINKSNEYLTKINFSNKNKLYQNVSLRKSQKNQQNLQNQIKKQKNKKKNHTPLPFSSNNDLINKIIKQTKDIKSYLQYIRGNMQPQNKYQIKLDFLNQYLKMDKINIISHIDVSCLKLIQSICLCITDILSLSIDKIENKMKNLDIVREYTIVYFQSYTKIKNEFIMSQILFKIIRNKFISFLIFQRITFFLILDLSLHENIKIDQNLSKNLVNLLKLNQQFTQILIETIIQLKSNKKLEGNNLTVIDTFKHLRIQRELDKTIPIFKQCFQALKTQINFYFFEQVKSTLLQLFNQIQRNQNIDIILLYKIEIYYTWKQVMIPPIFLLPQLQCRPFTLILDLDQTLIFYNEQTRILKYRPYMDRFINIMSKYFQLVIFSSNTKQRTQIIVKQIERDQKIFSYLLYKNHMVFQQGTLIKNISFLGRNMQKILMIDDQQKNVNLLPENSFLIKPFTGDKSDKQLLNLSNIITSFMQQKPLDLRGKLKNKITQLQQIQQLQQISSTIQMSINNQ